MGAKPLSYRLTAGFTLAEMAIVVLLISIAMTMGLKMVTAKLENAAYSETKAKQEQIKIALISYLRTNKKLPCPDNKAGVADGLEVSPCTADAAAGYGVVPWQALGISRDTAQDGWGNYFTYKVANGVAMKNWTSTTLTTPFDINELTTPTDALTIQESNGGTTKAVVVVLSHGKNGFGAKTVRVAARMPTAGAGADELTNATNTTTTFVRRPFTEDPGATGGAYDDLVAYVAPQELLQPLVSEGTLKTCYAYCPVVPSCTGGGVFSCSAGVGYCTGSGPACTLGGSPACTVGTPQCTTPGTGCAPTGIPIGATPATCL